VVCAFIQHGRVGIDVESINRDIYRTGLSFFHFDEIEYLLSQSEKMKRWTACELWTMKEAYVKCKGRGFAIPFESFSVLGSKDMVFQSFHIEDYCVSIAVESGLKNMKKRIKKISLSHLLEIH
jgi:phosphopantetheinyl transferase